MNDLERLHRTLLAFPGATEVFPFGPEAAVYKVAGKMFALWLPDEVPVRLNLKCDPERAVVLRDEHEAIRPGYHMNKRHWNTLVLDGSLRDEFVGELIGHSYDLVVAALPRAARERIQRSVS